MPCTDRIPFHKPEGFYNSFSRNGIGLSADQDSRVVVNGAGTDKKLETESGRISDERIGAVAEAYNITGRQIPSFKGGAVFEKLFGKGPRVEKDQFSNFKIPDLTSRPIGLWDPGAVK